jgi:hypothetical protein
MLRTDRVVSWNVAVVVVVARLCGELLDVTFALYIALATFGVL